jgi:Protein of unknown function (DUF1826)
MAGMSMASLVCAAACELTYPDTVGSRVAMAEDAAVLSEIYQDQINLAVWQRKVDAELADAVAALLAITSHQRHWQGLLRPDATGEWLDQHLPQFPARSLLLRDIELLVDMFSCLFELREVGLRLAILDIAMCPRFHTDRTLCRLVTTYGGPGTEWLAHDRVDRTRLGSPAQQDAEASVFQALEDIQQLKAGEVALLKGEAWAGNAGAGLVHRSPRIMQGDKRVLLTLDIA